MIKNNLNNAILSSANSSPLKAGTSDSTNSLARNKMIYTSSSSNYNSIQNPQKKWIGGSRNAGSVIERKKSQALGKSSFNGSGVPKSLVSTKDINVTKQALSRVRAGGAVAPPKKSMV